MECDKIELLMMKHMDGALTEDEKERLEKHIRSCEKCGEDFLIYEEIQNGLPEPMIFAPDNFETLVMEKINALPENKKFAGSIDNLLCVVWGIFSVMFGLGFLAVMNKESVIAYISENPSLSGYTDILVSISNFAESAGTMVMEAVTGASAEVSGYISASRYIILLIIAVLAVLQYVVYKKNKVGV